MIRSIVDALSRDLVVASLASFSPSELLFKLLLPKRDDLKGPSSLSLAFSASFRLRFSSFDFLSCHNYTTKFHSMIPVCKKSTYYFPKVLGYHAIMRLLDMYAYCTFSSSSFTSTLLKGSEPSIGPSSSSSCFSPLNSASLSLQKQSTKCNAHAFDSNHQSMDDICQIIHLY